MVSTDSPPPEAFWQEDPFGLVKPEEIEPLGIDPADIPPGTFASHRHPPLLSSRFGGNAYGFGFFEIYDRLDSEDVDLLQCINFENPEQIKEHYAKINQIYKRIGLLIRFSSLGKPYYLIPVHLLSSSISNIRNKADEISKIVEFHRKKYLKESHRIGLLTHADDPLINDLSIRFREHQFIIIDSLEKLRSLDETLDLVVITRDIYRIILMEGFSRLSVETPSRKYLEKYALYMLGKTYKILKPDGELFIIANRYPLKTSQTAKISFKSVKEQKNFLVFSHIFKTRKRYQMKGRSLRVSLFDLERYLGGLYIEQEMMDRLSGGRDPARMTLKEIDKLPYLNFSLEDEFAYDQQKIWPRLLSVYFDEIFHKPLIPNSIKSEWKRRFSVTEYSPDYMLIHLAQKKPMDTNMAELRKDIMESPLAGCPLSLLADYRDSSDFLIRTLNVLNNIKNNSYIGMPEVFMERLREPLENKRRRYSGLNDVLKLMSKVNKLERVRSYLNPDMIEGAKTSLLENMEILPLFGFSYGELREILLIIVGHTTAGRILTGKMNEKTLKPVSDLARTYDSQEALNLLRYCRLMCMAETMASKRSEMNQVQLAELFDLFDSIVRVVTGREMDWDRLLDEKISAMGGIHNKIIRKLLVIMNHLEFLDNWAELGQKGEMEKESLADYDDRKLARIENVIGLVRIIGEFEERFLKDDLLQLPIFYRKFLNMEFHGTGHFFERMDSRLVFILLWFAVNITRGEVVNFNPILADIKYSEIDSHVKKVEEESLSINTGYLDLATLKQFSDQLYENSSAFVMNTGFRFRLNPETQAVDISFIDMDENIELLEGLARRFSGRRILELSPEDLEEMEILFENLEDFYQGHRRLLLSEDSRFIVPPRQTGWFERAQQLRQYLKSDFIDAIFEPEDIHSNLELLYHHSPSLLTFALPEFMAFKDLMLSGMIYLRSHIIDYVLTSTRKIQALIRGDRKGFQDIQVLHKLAQREFGPMTAGIVGLNESQIGQLESIVAHLHENRSLFSAMIKAFIFQNLGLMPALRERYKGKSHPADQAQAGAFFLKKEQIPQRYNMDKEAEDYLVFLVKHHDRIHHLIRGEFSRYVLQEIIDRGDKDLFDAFFVCSFVMFCAMGEDLILEDLAARVFRIRELCHRVLEGKTTIDDFFDELYIQKGNIFFALEEYRSKGLPEETSPADYLESWEGDESDRTSYIQAGKMIYSMERIFRLRGIRYVEFFDLACLIAKVPLKFIYQKRNYYAIGYASFEKELFEALRIYNRIQRLPEAARHFILECLTADKVRIFGFENVSVYLNYENQIKLLLIALLGSQKFKKDKGMICLDFLGLVAQIDKRYEAVNDTLSNISVENIWGNRAQINNFFKAKTGLVLERNASHRVLAIDFQDRINISRKTSHMETITDVDQLKNYFHYSLQSLRKSPFYTEDYELQLEEMFNKRLGEITDLMLNQAKKQMEFLKDFREIHHLYADLMDRSLEIGFTEDQKHRLNDLYELSNDNLKREKLDEVNGLIEGMQDVNELKDYWDGIKYYLLNNRAYLGKEFENLISKNFDKALERIGEM